MDRAAVFAAVADARRRLADRLEGTDIDWDAPSLCEGWRVRDVLGHLVWLAEGTVPRVMFGTVRYGPNPMRGIERLARKVAADDPASLVARLRGAAGGRFVVPGAPKIFALGEVLVHGLDISRPAGLPDAEPIDAEGARAVVGVYRGLGRRAFRTPKAVASVRFVATDAGWSVGEGPEVAGSTADVLLAVSGRRGAKVEGPGVALLSRAG